MKLIVAMLVCCTAALAYNDIDDDYLVKVLHDDKLLRDLFGCIVDVNPCDDFGAHRKRHVEEVMKDGCRECDYIQRHNVHAHITRLRDDFPELFKKFEAKYDPSGKLIKKLDEDMLKYA